MPSGTGAVRCLGEPSAATIATDIVFMSAWHTPDQHISCPYCEGTSYHEHTMLAACRRVCGDHRGNTESMATTEPSMITRGSCTPKKAQRSSPSDGSLTYLSPNVVRAIGDDESACCGLCNRGESSSTSAPTSFARAAAHVSDRQAKHDAGPPTPLLCELLCGFCGR